MDTVTTSQPISVSHRSLHWVDYTVLAAFLAISLGIGVYHSLTGGRQRTTSEFIMANRSLSVLPTALSMLVSFVSAIMILGSTAEMYSYGSQYLLMTNIALILGATIAAGAFVPWLFPLKLVSVNEYLEIRYKSRSVRVLGSILGVTTGVIYMGTAMYAPSLALQAVTGLSISVSVPVMAAVVVTYTALGGMRAVIWTDVFQFGIMISGILAVLIKGLIMVGGVGRVAELCEAGHRLEWADWSPDPTKRNTVWAFLIGWTISWANQYGLEQAPVQRYSATKNISKARQVVMANIPLIVLINFCTCCIGLVAFAYYYSIGCDPMVNKELRSANQILPHFVTKIFSSSPGFTGLFLATLYGGALSSVSSSLSGVSANLWEDVLRLKLGHLKESSQALINRFLVIGFGFMATGFSFASSVLPGTVIQITLTISGSVYGPCLGMFLVGGLTRFAHWKGALVGCTVGILINAVLVLGSIRLNIVHPTLTPVSVEGCSSPHLGANFTDWEGVQTTTSGVGGHTLVYYYNDTTVSEHFSKGRGVRVEDLEGIDRVFALSYHWYKPLGILVTVVTACIVSLISRDHKAEESLDERVLFPCLRRDKLRCASGSLTAERDDDEADDDGDDSVETNGNSKVLYQPASLSLVHEPILGRRQHTNASQNV